MIRIAIVEDDKGCQESLQNFINRYQEEKKIDIKITIFQDGIDIIEKYNPIWDIIFMDIKMKHMHGMETAQKVREHDKSVIIIFITTMAQYAIKGYEVDALDFVLKPVTYPQFETKMDKAVHVLKKKEEKYLLLPFEDKKQRVSTKEIFYIEVKNHNLLVVTEGFTYSFRYSMQEIEAQLKDHHFKRCNNSYLINLAKVTGVKKEVVLVGNYELPISRPKKKEFLTALSDYLGASYY